MNKKALQEAFALFDKDGDGSITASELRTVLKSLGHNVSDDECRKMIKKVDRDGNGLIDMNEFMEMMGSRLEAPIEKSTEFRLLFNAFDKDNSGYIDKSELKRTMKNVGMNLSKKDVDNMMKTAGVQNKDKIFYEDFVRLMSGPIAKQHKLLKSEAPGLIISPENEKIQNLRLTFSTFDRDNDGRITVCEVHKTLNSLGMHVDYETCEQMVKQVDLDGNGYICFQEFQTLMQNAYGSTDTLNSLPATRRKKSSSSAVSEHVDLKEMFKIFDKDHDGYLSALDLKNTMHQIGINLTDDDVHDMMKAVNVRKDGKVSYANFQKIFSLNDDRMSRMSSMLSLNNSMRTINQDRDGLQAVFSLFDKDGDGYITMEEVQKVLDTMEIKSSPDYIKHIFQQVDLDGNGQIDFEEFILLTTRSENPQSEEREVVEMFRLIDKDHSGSIEVEELKEAFVTLGVPITDSDITDMLSDAHIKGKTIYFDDFVRIMRTFNLSPSTTSKFEQQQQQQQQQHYQKHQNQRNQPQPHQLQQSTSSSSSPSCLVVPSLSTAKQQQQQQQQQQRSSNINIDNKEPVSRKQSTTSTSTLTTTSNNSSSSHHRHQHHHNNVSPSSSSSFSSSPSPSLSSPNPMTIGASNDAAITTTITTTTTTTSTFTATKINAIASTRRRRTSSSTWEAFKMFDKNCDGYISKRELFETMKMLGMKLTLDDLNEMMKQADINGDGKIDYSEFAKLMTGNFEQFAEQAAQLHRQNSRTGANNNIVVPDLPGEEEMRASFRIFDINNDGFIDASELRQTIANFGGKCSNFGGRSDSFGGNSSTATTTTTTVNDCDIEAMIRSADKNNDGKIDYEEFISMFNRKQKNAEKKC